MLNRILRYAVVLAVTAFFAVMWGALLRRHLGMPPAEAVQPDYDALLAPGQDERSTSWGIYFGATRLGSSTTTFRRQDDGTISIRTDSEIRLTPAARYLIGVVGTLDVTFRAGVSPLRGLTYFAAESQLLDTTLQGTVRGDEILVTGRTGERRVRTTLPFDQGNLVGQALGPMTALPDLSAARAGLTWSFDMVNPVAGSLQRVIGTVDRVRELEIDGREVRVLQLSFATGGNRWSSWATEGGEVLVQGTPFGLELRREDLPPEVLEELTLPTGEAAPAS